MANLIKKPNIENIKSVDILTSSPFIMGDFYKEQINIITWK